MTLEIPGKTFLVGEYAVLSNGPALGLATAPCFTLRESPVPTVPHPESPAGRYLARHGCAPRFELQDPYTGGFGRSTAEFWAAVQTRFAGCETQGEPKFAGCETRLWDAADTFSFPEILGEYRELHAGSGVDLAIQYFGRVCEAGPENGRFAAYDWHFPELEFFVVSTGYKAATHEHLATLDPACLRGLPALSAQVITAYHGGDSRAFLESLETWAQTLAERDLTLDRSRELKKSLESHADIKLAKPCGALGADVILVFCERERGARVREFLSGRGPLKVVASSADLHAGLAAGLTPNKKGDLHVG